MFACLDAHPNTFQAALACSGDIHVYGLMVAYLLPDQVGQVSCRHSLQESGGAQPPPLSMTHVEGERAVIQSLLLLESI